MQKPVSFVNEDKNWLTEKIQEDFFMPVFGEEYKKDIDTLAKSFVNRILATGGYAFPKPACVEDIVQYYHNGCLCDVFREFKVVCKNDTKKTIDCLKAYFKIENQSIVRVMSIEEGEEVLLPSEMQKVFNTPFWPFVAISTTIGAEGLNFHSYCNRLVHYTVPPNVIALEQMKKRSWKN